MGLGERHSTGGLLPPRPEKQEVGMMSQESVDAGAREEEVGPCRKQRRSKRGGQALTPPLLAPPAALSRSQLDRAAWRRDPLGMAVEVAPVGNDLCARGAARGAAAGPRWSWRRSS